MAALCVAALAAAPVSEAKKSNVGGSILVSVPSFDPNSGTSLASGVVKAAKGCSAPRIVRFAFFNTDGTPVQAGQPTVVTAPGGSFIAALPEPFTPDTPKTYVVKVSVDPVSKKKKGKKVNCLQITGPDSAVTVPARN